MGIEYTIRPFETTDEDYEGFAAVELAVWPEYRDTVEEWKHKDETRDPKYLFHRFVAEVEGIMVASGIYCDPWWSMRPGKYFVNMSVHPDYRRRGIGTALYNLFMGELSEYDPATVITSTREDQADALRFLAKRGFRQQMRFPVSHLDVIAFDPAPFDGKVASVEASSIEIRSLAEVAATDPDWKRKLWDLEWELLQDVPSPEPLTRQTFENFEERELGHPGFNPDALFIALDAGRWVGTSGLWMAEGDLEKLYTGLTGVVRSHRRRGLATAMKVRGIAFAQAYGARIIETDNEENNPMYDLNLQLGFKPQPAWLSFEKQLKEDSG
jgi:GNAT superfamily N-acetyltransferase